MDLTYRIQRLKTECTYALTNVNISAVRNTTVYDDTVGEGAKREQKLVDSITFKMENKHRYKIITD